MLKWSQGVRLNRAKILFIVLAIVLMCVSESMAAGTSLTVEYSFESPRITEIAIGADTYHRLVMKDAPAAGNPGQPALPARGARILLPPGTEVESVEIVTGAKTFLGRDYLVEPVGQPYPLSADPAEIRLPVPDASIYQSAAVFPAQRYESAGTQSFRGYRILILKLQPVEYVPAEGELYFYSRLTVTVHLRDAIAPAALYRGLEKDAAELRSRVDNVETSNSYAPVPQRLSGSYDLLIITTPTLAFSFQPLKDYHDATGIPTEIHTIADIGSANPDAVRDYIRERYLNDGIEYVLIGGDDDLIPAKDLYVTGAGSVASDMPGDIYFGCLDGTYNYDGDSRWGEMFDGEGGGDVDLVGEVYVGRAPVGDATEAARFVNKTLQHFSSEPAFLQSVLMVGEYLGFGGISDFAAAVMDQLVNGSKADGYTTVGIPSQVYDVDRLYDRDWTDNDWPNSEFIDRVNAGTHIINHLGHGNTSWAFKMTSGTAASAFTNDEPCFIYSQACYSGQFDGAECWAEHAGIKTDQGAYAIIMNARYGWGVGNSTDGGSQRYNREFWDAIFNPYDYHPQIGKANQDSKEDNLYRINDGVMRWCCYEINLFGDPTISIDYGQAQPGLVFNFPEGLPDTIRPNQETTFLVDLVKVYDGTPVPASGLLHYRIDGGPIQSVPMTQITPMQYEATLPGVMCEQVLEYYVSADEATSGSYYDPDPATPHQPIVLSAETVVFADDFQIDQGWTVNGDATDGLWNRALPQGHGDRGDPMSDYDENYLCFLTGGQDGDTDVEGGTTYLESPVFDLSAGDAVIRYARWYCNDVGDNPNEDVFVVSVSNDNGENWTTAETVGPEQDASGDWIIHWFWAGDYVTPTDQMKVQFAASDLGGESIVEAAIDAFSVTQYNCHDCVCTGYCDLNADGLINPVDVVYIVNYVYKSLDSRLLMSSLCPGDNGDWNYDNQINPVDVVFYVNYVYKSIGGEPHDPCSQE